MTNRERMYATLRGEPADRILWQPRIELWYYGRRKAGTLPERYRDMSLIEVYDDLGCSIRAYDYYNQAIERVYPDDIRFETVEETPRRRVSLLHTPVGTLEQVVGRTLESELTREFYVKSIDDLPVIEHVLREQQFEFHTNKFREMDELIGDRCAPVTFNLRTPLMRMFIEYIGFENTIVAMHEFPERMNAFISLMEETDQQYYDMMKECPVEILNFGDNVDSNMLPPTLMRKYTLPYYQQRTKELHDAGMLLYPHWDGALAGLLPFVHEAGFDAYEALTPEPMGDVPLEEIAEALGHDYVLMDGIPASMFCKPFTDDEVREFTMQVLDTFSPTLILGVSDELPSDGEIERIRMVSEIVAEYTP